MKHINARAYQNTHPCATSSGTYIYHWALISSLFCQAFMVMLHRLKFGILIAFVRSLYVINCTYSAERLKASNEVKLKEKDHLFYLYT